MRKFLALLGTLSLVVPACTASTDESAEHEHEPEGTGEISQRVVDCKTRTDTGYSHGSSFPITVVTVDGKPVEQGTANAFYVMQQAAAKEGVNISVVSGFRTMAEQQYLYNCYLNKNCNNGNLAAKPGYSNHQSGHALDLNTKSGGVYNWLTAHGGQYGFKRTVPSEIWHWEWWGGGPGGGICAQAPKCDPHCEGSTMVAADCSKGNCGAFGASCADDDLGLRCVAFGCPAKGTKEFCVDEKNIGTCKDGAFSSGDCSKFASKCVKDGTGAKCESVICPQQAKKTSACIDGAKLLTCQGGMASIGDCSVYGAACTDKQGDARCIAPWAAKLVKRTSDAEADETKKADFKVCAGSIATTRFEVENEGHLTWTDVTGNKKVEYGKRIRLGTRDGDKKDFKDVFTDTSRVSVNLSSNKKVVWDGADCSDKDGCRRTVWEITGVAPEVPGIYKTSWKILDEGYLAFDTPDLVATYRVYDCPDEIRDGGTDPNDGEGGAGGAPSTGGAAGTPAAGGSPASGGASTATGGSSTSTGGQPGAAGAAGDATSNGGSSMQGGAPAAAGGSPSKGGAAGASRATPAGTTEDSSGCSVSAPRSTGSSLLVAMGAVAAALGARRKRRSVLVGGEETPHPEKKGAATPGHRAFFLG